MKRGTIILTPFPFTDLEENKVRPAIIISSDKGIILGDLGKVSKKILKELDDKLKLALDL